MKRLLSILLVLVFAVQVNAQTQSWREMHKVKKKETIYGIAHQYGITEQELRDANPEMKNEGYQLKKGDYIFIPYPKAKAEATQTVVNSPDKNADVRQRAIRLGVMLPLHNENGDGRRMVEYYRGVLMAIEDLKAEGISVDVRAWNLAEDANVAMTLLEDGVSDRDLIFGPLYTKQMDLLSQFSKAYGVKLVIPFSINGDHVVENTNIYQVYQPQSQLDAMAIDNFMGRFNGYNYVIIDCNDEDSSKGVFTKALRARFEESKLNYNITNLTSSDQTFARAFSLEKPNVVVLNTARSPQLNETFRKLNTLTAANKNIQISMFGYNEWLMYEKPYMELFYKYDTYIPTFYYYNTGSTRIKNLEKRYLERFGSEMMAAIPRFAITGYDQARFFLRGLHKDGKTFTGELSDKDALQTQFKFVRVGEGGGLKNKQFLFMHYNRNRTISTIVY
ncbi:MAG: LysM peptidoglycan-binding domain-containing protein [Prevotella sp.]|nr:LysM peptidoglycan-binding domain-containing protein [Prevotella sp.]